MEITAEIPAADDGLVTIRCSWEDLLDYYDHQSQLGCRTTVEKRIAETKEFFSNKLFGNSSHQPFKVPFSVSDKEESKAASRSGKHLSSTVTSGLDSGHVTDNKKVKGDKSKSTIYPSEDVHNHEHHGGTDAARGGSTFHPSHAHGSRNEERKSSWDRMSRDGSSSRSHSKDKPD